MNDRCVSTKLIKYKATTIKIRSILDSIVKNWIGSTFFGIVAIFIKFRCSNSLPLAFCSSVCFVHFHFLIKIYTFRSISIVVEFSSVFGKKKDVRTNVCTICSHAINDIFKHETEIIWMVQFFRLCFFFGYVLIILLFFCTFKNAMLLFGTRAKYRKNTFYSVYVKCILMYSR